MLERGITMHGRETHPRHIVVFESFWNDDAERKLSVAPLLELLSKRDGARYVMLSSATLEEFRFNLDVLRTVRKGGVLCLAFHGFPGGINLVDRFHNNVTIDSF